MWQLEEITAGSFKKTFENLREYNMFSIFHSRTNHKNKLKKKYLARLTTHCTLLERNYNNLNTVIFLSMVLYTGIHQTLMKARLDILQI